jgi:hypothetical protein
MPYTRRISAADAVDAGYPGYQSTSARTARVTAVERTGPQDPGTPASRDNDRLLVVTQGELAAEIAGGPTAVPA